MNSTPTTKRIWQSSLKFYAIFKLQAWTLLHCYWLEFQTYNFFWEFTEFDFQEKLIFQSMSSDRVIFTKIKDHNDVFRT